MVTGNQFDRLLRDYSASLLPEPIPVDVIIQGGGSRGALAGGVVSGLFSRVGIVAEMLGGTSAGANVAVNAANGFALEKLNPHFHTRRDTVEMQADTYRVVSSLNPYNYADGKTRAISRVFELGIQMQQVMLVSPFAALMPEQYKEAVHAAGRNILNQFRDVHRELTMPLALHQVATGKKHILEVLSQSVIGNMDAVNSAAAPLTTLNFIRKSDGKQIIVHNRDRKDPLQFAHVAASGALTPYLPLVDVPGHGPSYDGALGGGNPPLMDFMRLKENLMPQAKSKTVILISLSSADENLEAEFAARDPSLHNHFMHAQERKRGEIEAFRREYRAPHMRLIEVKADLTPEQRAESLADTRHERLKGLFATGVRQGRELADQLIAEELSTKMPARLGASSNGSSLNKAVL